MISRKLPILLLGLSIAFVCSAEEVVNLDALNADLTTLFTSIGRDISPRLHQTALSGNDLVGEARLRGFSRTYLTVAGASVTIMDGAAKVLASDDSDLWKFSLLSIPNVVKDTLGTDKTANDSFDLATGGAFPLASLRLGIGFPLPFGLELLANGVYLPESLVETGIDLAGESLPVDLKNLGVRVEMLTAGGILRKPILSDKKGFLRPSLSIGAGYTYSRFALSVDSFNLDALDVEITSDDTGGFGALTMDGELGFEVETQAYGAVLHISKNVLWLFTPFAKASAYYHVTDYSSRFKVNAKLTPDAPEDGSAPGDPIEQALDAPVLIHTEDVSIILSGGLELKLFPFVLTTCVSLDMERPIVDVRSVALDGFKLNGTSVTIAARLQI